MSYNITDWRTKKIKGFMIPLRDFFKSERKEWHPTKSVSEDGKTITLESVLGQEIKGYIKDDFLIVKQLDMSGEGSGTFSVGSLPSSGRSLRISSSLESIILRRLV